MNQVIDPVTGMPVLADPAQQMIQQQDKINVGMPGSIPIPAGVAQNLPLSVQAGGKMLSPINK